MQVKILSGFNSIYRKEPVRSDKACFKDDIREFFQWILQHGGSVWDTEPIEVHNSERSVSAEVMEGDSRHSGDQELKPCPFCGGRAEVKPLGSNEYSKYKFYYPTCMGEIRDNCPGIIEEDGDQGGTNCDCKTVVGAINLWNQRIA